MFRLCWSSRWACFVVVGAVLCASASMGCGAKKATVSGTVSYKGEKLGNGNITFVGADNKAATSQIKADGTYSMINVPVGTVKIQVETVAPADKSSGNLMGVGAPMMGDQSKGEAGKYVKIPDKFKDSGKSGLTYDVKPGKQTHDVNLSD